MTINWAKVRYFIPPEFGASADKMSPDLIYALDQLRDFCKQPIRINSAYRANDPGSTHNAGLAADIVISGLSLIDQYLVAEKLGLFTGIGLYPFWNTPGLHLDTRKLKKGEPGKRWIRDAKGNYIALNAANLKLCE